MNEKPWSRWREFPDPMESGRLHAPIGPGVYDLRRCSSAQLVYCGSGKNAALRMTSLLPNPVGTGTRNNAGLRQNDLNNLADIEYRTLACADHAAAQADERTLKKRGAYLFSTYTFRTATESQWSPRPLELRP